MDTHDFSEYKGRIFIGRIQAALKKSNETSIDEMVEKVEEFKDLMITLVKMLKYAGNKLHILEQQNSLLSIENKDMAEHVNEMHFRLSEKDEESNKYKSLMREYEDLKNTYQRTKSKLMEKQKDEIQKQINKAIMDNDIDTDGSICTSKSSWSKLKTKKTQTERRVDFDLFSKGDEKLISLESIFPNHSLFSTSPDKIDWNLHKLQTFLMQKEQTWHLTSGREREQRTKISRLLKEMRILQNQLDWKNNQLSYKNSEIMEKGRQLETAERKLMELKQHIRTEKRKKLNSYGLPVSKESLVM